MQKSENSSTTSRAGINGTFKNPFIWADVPDLDVIRVGETYYMTSTTMYFTPGCPVMKSKDLVNWEIVNYVYDILDESDCMTLKNGKHDYGKGSWASCLRYHDGIYYVSLCAYNTGKTYIFQTEDIEKGSWRRYEIDGIYHDMSLLFDDDGRIYMVYGGGAIKVVELTSDASGIKPGGLNKVIIENADISGGKSLAEGSHIYKLNGRYYIFIIAWPRTGTGRRIEVCYRSDKIDGIYEGRVVLDDNMGFQNAGVAQGGIVDTPDGRWYAPLFQDHGAVGRIPVLVPVKWEDGWCIFGENGKVPHKMQLPVKECEAKSIVTSDDFDESTLALEWQWNHNPDNDNWSLTKRPGWLRLTAGSICGSLTDARNTLTQRTFGPTCSGNILIDAGNMKDGDFAGLAALQEIYGFVGVKTEGDSKYIIMAKAAEQTERPYKTGIPAEEIERVPLEHNIVYLRVDFDFKNADDEAYFYYSLDGTDWHKIGNKLKMSYRLSHFTGYRFALFNFATQTAGGYVDFDCFKLSDNIIDTTKFVPSPKIIENSEFTFPSFRNGNILFNKRQGRLPAMGWNSWNAFGSGNTENLTKAMADALVDLELSELGYKYVVLDDGCYLSNRVDGKLSNEPLKFPGGFKALGDYIHNKGLKFGMYNDIGTHLCAGAEVGTFGFEDVDAAAYKQWGIDFIKVDNCYYMWDNATFSKSSNAQYVYTPNIKSVTVSGAGLNLELCAVNDGILLGKGGVKTAGYVTNIGTFDGTNTGTTPIGELCGELQFIITAPSDGEYSVMVNYASGEENGIGRWLQIAVGSVENEVRYFDDFLPKTSSSDEFTDSKPIAVKLKAGENIIRLMNHRRQENTLQSYAALLDGFNKYDPNHDTVLSICEWGKTQPHHWGYKVGNSWRILNDITFSVGNAAGNPGRASWNHPGTASIVSQYNKAVIMDEFAGLDKGWNDPDMMVIGMNGITQTMSKTHMTMWCMMNAPLMLGFDLRRINRGDDIWNIIANKEVIELNQDSLGIQAKRIYCSNAGSNPDSTYITDNNRVDILAKPLADGVVALSFINLAVEKDTRIHKIDKEKIISYLGNKMVNTEEFKNAERFLVTDLWTKKTSINSTGIFSVSGLNGCDSVTIKITPVSD